MAARALPSHPSSHPSDRPALSSALQGFSHSDFNEAGKVQQKAADIIM